MERIVMFIKAFMTLGWVMLVVCVLGVLVGVGLLANQAFIAGAIFIVVFGYLLLGLRTVQQQERRVMELFGRYVMTLGPGLQWILPGAMKFRATIGVWEQRIPLFETPIKIDFKDGSARPKGAEAFLRIKSPDTPYEAYPGELKELTGVYRAIYLIANWREAARDLFENALRSYLNGLTIDDAITMAKAGYDLATTDPDLGLPNHEIERIKKVLAGWGFELTRVTITDFDLEPDLVAARGEVQKRHRAAEAARHEATIRALETTGTLIAMTSEFLGLPQDQVRQQIAADPALRARFQSVAEELVSRQVSIAGKALTDIRVAGGDDLARGLIAVIAAIKKA